MQTPNPKHTPRRIVLTLLCLLMAAAIMLSCTQCKKQEEKTDAASKAETSDTKDGGGTKSDASADALTFMTPEIPDDGFDDIVVYYGCPNSKKAKKLQLDKNLYR